VQVCKKISTCTFATNCIYFVKYLCIITKLLHTYFFFFRLQGRALTHTPHSHHHTYTHTHVHFLPKHKLDLERRHANAWSKDWTLFKSSCVLSLTKCMRIFLSWITIIKDCSMTKEEQICYSKTRCWLRMVFDFFSNDFAWLLVYMCVQVQVCLVKCIRISMHTTNIGI
jgi:hypothetical protein